MDGSLILFFLFCVTYSIRPPFARPFIETTTSVPFQFRVKAVPVTLLRIVNLMNERAVFFLNSILAAVFVHPFSSSQSHPVNTSKRQPYRILSCGTVHCTPLFFLHFPRQHNSRKLNLSKCNTFGNLRVDMFSQSSVHFGSLNLS